MALNGISIEPHDCLYYESVQKNDIFMFPLYNKYRCLKNKDVQLDNFMMQCLAADEDPLFIEQCF